MIGRTQICSQISNKKEVDIKRVPVETVSYNKCIIPYFIKKIRNLSFRSSSCLAHVIKRSPLKRQDIGNEGF